MLVDTNVWLSAADRRARHHRACAELLDSHHGSLASTCPVIAETSWLLLDRGGPLAQQEFVGLVVAGAVEVIDPTTADWVRVLELISTYGDAELDVVDASLIAAAERLGETTIATLDERDFRLVRPAHVDSFELVPERR